MTGQVASGVEIQTHVFGVKYVLYPNEVPNFLNTLSLVISNYIPRKLYHSHFTDEETRLRKLK